MTKNIYAIRPYDINSIENAFLYIEAENLKDALIKYLEEKEDLSKDEFCTSGLFIKKIKIENKKALAKDMKNRTVLK